MPRHLITHALPLFALLAAGLSHAGTIRYQVTPVFPAEGLAAQSFSSDSVIQRYTYYSSDFTFLANQELDIVFPAGVYTSISNGVMDPGFDLMLFQPNDPPGASGHFSALALFDIGLIGGPWSVEFTLSGPDLPGCQAFFINQYDGNGRFVTTLESGATQPFGGSSGPGVPEPGTLSVTCLTAVWCGVWWFLMRRSTTAAHRGPGAS